MLPEQCIYYMGLNESLVFVRDSIYGTNIQSVYGPWIVLKMTNRGKVQLS